LVDFQSASPKLGLSFYTRHRDHLYHVRAKFVRNVAGGFMIEVNRQAQIRFSVRSLVVLLLAVVATLTAACAATPTQESTGGYIDDSTITAKVKTNLAEDNKVSATDIHVKTYKGVVDLSGFVNSQSQISRPGSLQVKCPE
jgi:hypothetical protein